MSDQQPFWPSPTSSNLLTARRERFARCFFSGDKSVSALLVSGWPRARNFPHNPLEYRAESHFLYLLGHSLPGAALLVHEGQFRLFATAPAPENKLWHGPEPSLQELSEQWELPVLPLEQLPQALASCIQIATIAPQDPKAASWLSKLLGRLIVAGETKSLQATDEKLTQALISVRLLADKAGVEQMRQAAEVTARSHRLGMAATRVGEREARVCAAMQASIAGDGMVLAYGPIVTTRGQVLHSHHHHHIMRAGDLLLVDVGAETPEGWAADVTRTWPVSGTFSPTQRAVYEVVLAAEQAAIDKVQVGVRFAEVHRAAQDSLTEGLVHLGILKGSLDELRESDAITAFFPHGVGHLIGLDVHDMEDLGDRAGYAVGSVRGTSAATRFLRLDRVLQPGMAVTVEPGFYQIPDLLSPDGLFGKYPEQLDRQQLAKFGDVQGIRIEDDIWVTQGGCEVLSAATPKTVKDVEQAMRG